MAAKRRRPAIADLMALNAEIGAGTALLADAVKRRRNNPNEDPQDWLPERLDDIEGVVERMAALVGKIAPPKSG